jgi:hypothetical protein
MIYPSRIVSDDHNLSRFRYEAEFSYHVPCLNLHPNELPKKMVTSIILKFSYHVSCLNLHSNGLPKKMVKTVYLHLV